MYDSAEVKKVSGKKEKAPVLFIELCDQRDGGWRMDAANGEPNPNGARITSPSAEFIPNRGFRLVKGKNPNTGKDELYNEEIRYIKNQRELSVEKQKQLGIFPSKNKLEDKIIVKRGGFSVTREGAFIGLYDYLKEVFYNATNPDRSNSAKKIFRVVEVGKSDEEFNEAEIAYADAVQFIGTLRQKQGSKFIYDEQRIDALCQLFLVYAETPAGKMAALVGHAKRNPADFLNKAMKLIQTIQTNIVYGLELSVIKFDGNVAAYCHKDKVITDFGRGNLSQEKKIDKLADFFSAPENKAALDEFMVELEVAAEKK